MIRRRDNRLYQRVIAPLFLRQRLRIVLGHDDVFHPESDVLIISAAARGIDHRGAQAIVRRYIASALGSTTVLRDAFR